ncbi:MAG: protein phosphatase 2C domain-containing protein [Chloroflexota bacterium]
MRELIERLFGRKERSEQTMGDNPAAGTGQAADASPTGEPKEDLEAGPPPVVQGRGVLNNTMVVTGEDLSEQILMAAGNVFEDTLPSKTALEETAVGRPAEAPAPVANRLVGLNAAQCCHIGNIRERNEDSSFIFTAEFGGQEPLLPAGLYIVADGMGGHHAGHEASKNAARLAAQHVLEKIYVPLLHDSSARGGHPQEPIGEVMVDAVQAANHYIHDNDPKKNSGTTLTAALILGKRLYVAHVGDSRAYLYTGGKLKLLTTDHSYVRRLQDAGQLTEEEAAVHPQRNMLYKAVGQGGDLDIDTFTQTLPQQGKLVLCSDGLWGLVSDASIAEVISRELPLPDMADELVMMARTAGGHDNITAIVIDFNFSPPTG